MKLLKPFCFLYDAYIEQEDGILINNSSTPTKIYTDPYSCYAACKIGKIGDVLVTKTKSEIGGYEISEDINNIKCRLMVDEPICFEERYFLSEFEELFVHPDIDEYLEIACEEYVLVKEEIKYVCDFY